MAGREWGLTGEAHMRQVLMSRAGKRLSTPKQAVEILLDYW